MEQLKNVRQNKRMSNEKGVKTRKRKQILGLDDDDEELKQLERIVLGEGDDIFDNDATEETVVEEKSNEKAKKPAWVDEADGLLEYKIGVSPLNAKNFDQKFREGKFHQIGKKPKWAEYSAKSDKTDILKKSGNIIQKPDTLEQYNIEIKKLSDLNSQTYSEGPIKAIKFHPKSTVALVAGLSGVVSLFQVDGKENNKLQSTKYNKFPVECASFVNGGDEYIIGSKQSKHFHTFNLMTGQSFKMTHKKMDGIVNMRKFVVSPDDKYIAVVGLNGQINLLSAKTKECLDSFQMNCYVNAISFSHDGSKMYSHGDDGEVYIWDMRAKKCIQKFTDDGCLAGTAIDTSSNNNFLACGSSSGVVNVYDVNNVISKKYEPLKIFYNLVTPITDVKFNPTSEILCISSNHKEKAVRLIHLPSMTVFANFPILQSKVHNVTCVDFSPNSGYLALGDSRKLAHLFRLKYYGNY